MLYKYLPPERIDVLENFTIRFTQLLSLNDPFEHSLMIGNHEYALDEDKSSDDVRFVSLSRNHTNLLMWSHYAASHTGFCVGFNEVDPFFNKALCIRYRRLRSSLNGARIGPNIAKDITKHIALEKAIDWAYEEEERLFLDDVDTKPIQIGFDPWGRSITIAHFPKASVSAIYLGLRADAKLTGKIVSSVRKHNLAVDVFKAKRSWNEFGLSFIPIEQDCY